MTGRRRRTGLAVTLVAMSVCGALGLPAQPVAADIQCNTGRSDDGQSYYAGTSRTTSGTPTEVVANILEERPHVWPVNSDVYAWTLMTRPDNPNGNRYWAQIGWHEHRSSSSAQQHHTFTSFTDSVGHFWVFDYSAATIGTTPAYSTKYSSPNYLLDRGTSNYYSGSLGWVPTNVQIEGEIHSLSSQMAGGTATHVTFRNSKYSVTGGGLVGIGSAAATDTRYFGAVQNAPSTTSYDIWDKSCAS